MNKLLLQKLLRLILIVVCGLLFTGNGLTAQNGGPQYPSVLHGGYYIHNYYFPPAPSSTPWAPSWSPDGRWIAISMSGSIWKVDPNTGISYELTYDESYHSSPDWSQDGKWIIYTADDGGTTIQLRILNVETGETWPLTDDRFIYLDPVFSPDGNRVAYTSTKPNGYLTVYVRPIRNGRWTGDEIDIAMNDLLDHNHTSMHITPAWLPDSQELLIVSNKDVVRGSGNVLRVPVAPNGIDQARTVLEEQTLYRTRPSISLDGKRFVYSSTGGTADQFNNLYVQPTIGGDPYKLTFFQHDAFYPRWSPDGEWIAYISNEGGISSLALLESYGGTIRSIPITDRRWKRPTGVLIVRTIDEETGNLTGSRVHLTAADGKFYAPHKTYARVTRRADQVFHTSGQFRLVLPPGTAELMVVKGFEFWPEAIKVHVKPNEITSISLNLRRMTNMAAKGWFNGSTHVHMNYGGNLHNTLENLLLMSDAEDQDLVLEQIANRDNRILDYQFFVPGGGPHPVSTAEQLVVVGQEYRPSFYGHAFMFGMKNHLISPFTTGYQGTAVESLYPSNTDMFRKAKAQGATVGYVHAFGGENDPLDMELGGAKGFLVDAALETTDALEWSDASRAGFYPLYAAWNNGLKVTAVGGEDSISDLHRSKLVGALRTYVYTGEQGLDMNAWFSGLRAGRAFVSSGPLVELTVNDQKPGETVVLPDTGGVVEVEGYVRSITPLEKVLLVLNGEVIEEILLDGDRRLIKFTRQVSVTQSSWIHLRAEGNPLERFPLDSNYAQAFTNPVWITTGDQPIRSHTAAEYAIRWIDKLWRIADAWPGWRSLAEREHVFTQFEDAKKIYLRFADEARNGFDPQASP